MQLNKVVTVTAPVLEAFVNVLFQTLQMQHVTVLQFCWRHEISFHSVPIWVSEKEGKSQHAWYGMCISVLSNSHTTVVQKFLHR